MQETLDSIIDQTYPAIQLIIVDDHSQDDSVLKIEEWMNERSVDCKFIAKTENSGICAAINDGLAISKGEFYQVIACDDSMISNKIEVQVNLFLNNPEVSLIHSSATKFDEKGSVLEERFVLREDFVEGIQDNAMLMRRMMGASVIIAPSVLIRVGHLPPKPVYDESLIFEDLYFFLKFLDMGRVFYFMEEPLVKYRVVQDSLYRSKKLKTRYNQDRERVIRSYLKKSFLLDIAIYNNLNRRLPIGVVWKGLWSGEVSLLQYLLKLKRFVLFELRSKKKT